MTTGRINQVTILGRSPGRRGPVVPAEPLQGPESSDGWGGAICHPTPAWRCPERELNGGTAQAIQLPRLKSSKDGPPQKHLRPAKAVGELKHTSLERRMPAANHALWADTGFGLPPNIWSETIAIGQSSTESIKARGINPRDFRGRLGPNAFRAW